MKKKRKKDKDAYRQRRRSLKALGFKTYTEYLNSSVWAEIRRRVLARDHHRCFSCYRKAGQVHHESYDVDTMSGETLDLLKAVCWGCHRRAERGRAGSYLGLTQANARLRLGRLRRHRSAAQQLLRETAQYRHVDAEAGRAVLELLSRRS